MQTITRAVLLVVFCATTAVARTPIGPPDPVSLRRSPFSWNQAEREVGFAHWDAIFPGRVVQSGSRVRPLPSGRAIAGLSPGTPGARELERFITDQKVAGLIVLHRGTVRLERYALGYGASGRWTSQSVAKSVTSTLLGAAIKDGFIRSIDQPVTTYVPGLRGSAYDGVTIRHLLTMTSGVRWTEDYTDPASDVARFHIEPVTPGMDATVSYMRRLPREAPPGTKWVYKTGETHLLGVVVTSATRHTLAEYLSATIWRRYGMEQPASWTTDRTNHELAGCCLQAGLRDFARYGQLVLDRGRVDGRSIVPDGWLEAATRRQVATPYAGGYGYQWWISDDGTFDARGIHGQLIHIDPARHLVVAINAAWPVATSPDRSAARRRMMSTIAAMVDAEGGR
jgi:CubicO group peptidase (beta-lactamase class C family)